MTEKRITSIAKNTKETSGKRKIKRSYSSLKVSTEYKEWRKHVYRNCRYLFQICYPGDIYLAVEKIKEIKFDNFTFRLEVIETEKSKQGIKSFIGKCNKDVNTEDITVVKICIKSEKTDCECTVYSFVGADIKKSTIGYKYHNVFDDDGYWINLYDLQYTLGYIKMLDLVYDESIKCFKENNDLYESSIYENVSYKREDCNQFLELKSTFNFVKFKVNGHKFLMEMFLYIVARAQNKELMDVYLKNSISEYAKSYQDKKYVPDKLRRLMHNNSQLKDFKSVELDADIDIEKYLDINTQYIKFRKELDFEKLIPAKNATLRFRKLGQHKALGMYYPAYKCLCVDIHSTSSFLHELGHYIDFERNALSMQKEFLPVLLKYKEVFNSKRNAGEKVPDYYKRKLGYFFTPTEVFARCFEIYIVVIKKYSNSFTKTIDFMKSSIPYPICSKSFIEMIDNYFSNFCDVKIEKFSDEEVFNNIENLSSRRMAAKKIVENVSDNIELNVLENGQVAFF